MLEPTTTNPATTNETIAPVTTTADAAKRKREDAQENEVQCDAGNNAEGALKKRAVRISSALPPQSSTVGAIAVARDGTVAAGVSSGGLWLKLPGRLGPSAMPGCGCFATELGAEDGIAVSTSGSTGARTRRFLWSCPQSQLYSLYFLQAQENT
jgi:isoaspartyl peptidase/L-asparaginase-like protein (Ntn-hydrolase superfamily)